MRNASASLRIVCLAIACMAGCKSGKQDNDAVRQGVVDYLQKAGINVPGMDITVANVKYSGNQADAAVNMGVKGSGATSMSMSYHLELKDNKWVVVGKQDSSQHGAVAPGGAPGAGPAAGAMPGADNPHAGGGGKMPSPEDLPPAGKKK